MAERRWYICRVCNAFRTHCRCHPVGVSPPTTQARTGYGLPALRTMMERELAIAMRAIPYHYWVARNFVECAADCGMPGSHFDGTRERWLDSARSSRDLAREARKAVADLTTKLARLAELEGKTVP